MSLENDVHRTHGFVSHQFITCFWSSPFPWNIAISRMRSSIKGSLLLLLSTILGRKRSIGTGSRPRFFNLRLSSSNEDWLVTVRMEDIITLHTECDDICTMQPRQRISRVQSDNKKMDRKSHQKVVIKKYRSNFVHHDRG